MQAASTFAASLSGKVKAVRVLRGEVQSPWDLDLLQRELFEPVTVKELVGMSPPVLSAPSNESDGRSGLAFAQLVDAEIQLYLQRTLLPDADAFSMTHSLELRVPFVDKLFFEAASRQANAQRRPLRKRDLADALGDPYLRQLTKATKKGFSLPMARWLADGPLESLVKHTRAKDAPIWDVMDRARGLAILATGSARWSEVWSLVALNSWITSLGGQS
jgi:asparagine synthase (glutamine-hydrolysing)